MAERMLKIQLEKRLTEKLIFVVFGRVRHQTDGVELPKRNLLVEIGVRMFFVLEEMRVLLQNLLVTLRAGRFGDEQTQRLVVVAVAVIRDESAAAQPKEVKRNDEENDDVDRRK